MNKKLFFIFLFLSLIVVLMNMIYPVISCIKHEVYERTQDHMSKYNINTSEAVYFSQKDLANAEWKEEKEFILNGFSYDIIKVDLKNGQKQYQCYVDKKDIVLNSILKFSGLFASKKVYAWRHFSLPFHNKKIIKTSGFFMFPDSGQLLLFTFDFTSEPDYFKRFENSYSLSVFIPPPEESFFT
ncbi:hypothetical protein [uncultured Chryseobacterium sp.]|uniref:hypothetical protein n=1 Tax=uncultured Chryseobacterium sp. TaxID=259322 RepID=UPI0025EE6A30|nr:hypothetical protein [uncultured Chryseobacterium sp.]